MGTEQNTDRPPERIVVNERATTTAIVAAALGFIAGLFVASVILLPAVQR